MNLWCFKARFSGGLDSLEYQNCYGTRISNTGPILERSAIPDQCYKIYSVTGK